MTSSTHGHRHSRDLCHNPCDVAGHCNDTASQQFYSELMRIKHEEFSPQSGEQFNPQSSEEFNLQCGLNVSCSHHSLHWSSVTHALSLSASAINAIIISSTFGFNESWSHDHRTLGITVHLRTHVLEVASKAAASVYALNALKAHGLQVKALFNNLYVMLVAQLLSAHSACQV